MVPAMPSNHAGRLILLWVVIAIPTYTRDGREVTIMELMFLVFPDFQADTGKHGDRTAPLALAGIGGLLKDLTQTSTGITIYATKPDILTDTGIWGMNRLTVIRFAV